MTDVLIPRLSDPMEEGRLPWCQADGDAVARGDELVEIETDRRRQTRLHTRTPRRVGRQDATGMSLVGLVISQASQKCPGRGRASRLRLGHDPAGGGQLHLGEGGGRLAR